MRSFTADRHLFSDALLIDVRSPTEFAKGHIPGAVHLPLFSDLEREEVGTSYKKQGKAIATRKGIEFTSVKLPQFVAKVDEWTNGEDKHLRLYCWRGGMRSGSMAWLLHTAGYRTEVLEGGYKAFRKWGSSLFRAHWNLRILTGYTGSGKTEVLQELKALGAQVIDLEDLAAHRGSSFGGLGKGVQPSTEQFQNRLIKALTKMDPELSLWLEDESIRIGQCHLPDLFFDQMKESQWVRMERPREFRLKHLVDLYGSADPLELEQAIRRLQKRLGGERMNECLHELGQGALQRTAALLLDYYDKSYELSMKERDPDLGTALEFKKENHQAIARTLRNLS